MVPDNRQRNPVQQASQGSLVVLLNLTLKKFRFNSDSMFTKKLVHQGKMPQAGLFRKPHKQSVDGVTMTALRGIMADRGIEIKTILQFEDFPEIFRMGQDSADVLYLVQCEIRRMRKSLQHKNYYQDNQAPIPYWRCSKKATKPSWDWFFENCFLYDPTAERFFDNVLRDDNEHFIHNPAPYLKAQDNLHPGYCKKIIKIVQFQKGKDTTSELADHADILRRPYLNTTLFNDNEDYITKSPCLTTAVGQLPKSVDNRASKEDLLEDMKKPVTGALFRTQSLNQSQLERTRFYFQPGVVKGRN
jgi:hypothetical protein